MSPAELQREWADLAFEQLVLLLEEVKTRHPHYVFQGMTAAQQKIRSAPPDPRIQGTSVTLLRNTKLGRNGRGVLKVTIPGYVFRFPILSPDPATLLLYTVEWTAEDEERKQMAQAERRAQEKLRECIAPSQWDDYFVNSAFAEQSLRSQLTYLFRRGFPTLVFRQGPPPRGLSFLVGLCLHIHGHAQYSWRGELCPTDDVIAHLLLMRTDERRFWAKANHHTLDSPGLGI